MGHLTIVRDDDPTSDLTDRQREVLDFISGSINKCGYPPTLREIGTHFGIRSTNGVNDHLRALEKKGYLQREDLKSRALRPLLASSQTVDVPILGNVAAGQPLLAVRNHDDTVKVDRFFIGQNREVFALRVQGESMIEDGILDGDYVFVRKQLQASSGETVVVMIGDEATVKRYYPEGDSIRFQPANAAMEPIVVRKRDFRSVNLLGVVIGIYRKLH
jgi:repressor LexA